MLWSRWRERSPSATSSVSSCRAKWSSHVHQHKLSTPLRELCIATNLSLPALIMSDWKRPLVYILHIKVAPCQYQASPETQICLQSAALIGCWVSIKYQQSSDNRCLLNCRNTKACDHESLCVDSFCKDTVQVHQKGSFTIWRFLELQQMKNKSAAMTVTAASAVYRLHQLFTGCKSAACESSRTCVAAGYIQQIIYITESFKKEQSNWIFIHFFSLSPRGISLGGQFKLL